MTQTALNPPWLAGDEMQPENRLCFLYPKRLPDFKIPFAIIAMLYKVEKNLTHNFSSLIVASAHHERIYV